LLIGRAASQDYGLLGGRLTSDSVEETKLTVGVVPVVWKRLDELSRFETPVTYPTNSPFIGLPAEFGKPVLEGASSCPCPPGSVLFDCAAFTATGSNIWIFRYLGSVIMRLLVLDDFSESNLVKVITAFQIPEHL
jgi:hypothetical protein